MGRRNASLRFAAGLWVFPGGRVDDEDWAHGVAPVIDLDAGDGYATPGLLDAGRNAAVREAEEEARIVLDPDALVPLSLWTPPPEYPQRFGTLFFLAPAPAETAHLAPDGGEILELRWLTAQAVLDLQAAGEGELLPPTYITLDTLLRFSTVDDALAAFVGREPPCYATLLSEVEGGMVARYEEDVAYVSGDLDLLGPRHRLWMLDDGWRYERT
jgi:8-oxo-dGTP pyrophosphatase MutT (NUDIX family)